MASRTAGLTLGCLSLLATANAQDARIVVQDSTGILLPDASITYRVGDGAWQKAVHAGDGTATLIGASQKAAIDVEHPVFGRQTFELTLPDENGVVVVRMDAQGAAAKFRSARALTSKTTVATSNGVVSCATGVGCQLPDQLGHGGGGTLAATSDLNPNANFRVADNFTATSGGSITAACWWGIYLNFSTFTDCGPGPGDNFTITYYNDDGAGTTPGSVLAGPFSVTVNKTTTGNVVCAGSLCLTEYQYEASHAAVNVSAGTCYWIEIANNTGAGQCFWLWNAAPPGDGRAAQSTAGTYAATDFDLASCVDVATAPNGCGAPAGPANDDCADAIAISGTGTFAFDNSNATQDGPGDILCDAFGTTDIDRDVWWCWTAPSSGDFLIQTCGLTSVDTRLAAYNGCGCPVGAALACSDDTCSFQSAVSITATGGNAYMIRVGTFPGAAGGSGSFSITADTTSTNDLCTDAIGPLAVPSVTAGSTDFQTVDSQPSCIVGNTSPGVWYTVIGTGTTLTADVCNGATSFDSKISVYCGDCANPTCIDGNDDSCGLQSSVSWCSQLGATYLILVHGFGGDSGPFELRLTDNGVSCTPSVNCIPPGACCTSTGCVLTDPANCAAIGGQFQGSGTSCGGIEYIAVTCTQQWEDIEAIGTQLSLDDDDGVIVPLPFAFTFFGNTYNSVGICSNGYLTFDGNLTDFSNDPIPSAATPNDIVAALWDDLDPSSGGAIYYHASGVAPNRALVVSWIGVPQFSTADANTFQAILFEQGNRISLRYLNVTPEGSAGDYTIGAENSTGTTGVSIAASTIGAGVCWRIVPDTVASDCDESVEVDVTPGTCPNPFNSDSRGALEIAVVGTPTFDASTIDHRTTYLTRADGIGVAVSPFKGPPGPHASLADVATANGGPCTAAQADGLLDLRMQFRVDDVLDSLELAGLPFGTQVPITVSGFLTDGNWFEGQDVLTLVPPPTAVNLNVRSNVFDSWITVAPRDLVLDGDGWTHFDRWYDAGTTVTLTASQSPLGAFVGWRVNGQIVGNGNPTLTLTVGQSMSVWAVYDFNRSTWGTKLVK